MVGGFRRSDPVGGIAGNRARHAEQDFHRWHRGPRWRKLWLAAKAEHAALVADIRAAIPQDADTVMREAFAQVDQRHEAPARVLMEGIRARSEAAAAREDG